MPAPSSRRRRSCRRTRAAGRRAYDDQYWRVAIDVAKSDNHLGFRSGGKLVFSRLIEGPYPNYEQVIPRENDKAAWFDLVTAKQKLFAAQVVFIDRLIQKLGLELPGAEQPA